MNYTFNISETLNNKIDSIAMGARINETSLKDFFDGICIEALTFDVIFTETLSSSDQDLLNTIVSEHDGVELQIEMIKDSYIQRRSDGIEYHDTFRANIYLSYLNGDMSFEQVIGMEGKLDTLTQKVVNGDWISAKYELETLSVDEILTQQKYDEIHTYIVNYIQNNY